MSYFLNHQIKSHFIRTVIFVTGLFSFAVLAESAENSIPKPSGIKSSLELNSSHEQKLSAFLAIPYRIDGAVDENGKYVLFNKPDKSFDKPGVNCSGFVLASSRFLLNKNIPLEQVMKDRLGDSSQESQYGEDWDFGFDFITNIAEGLPAKFILPGGMEMDPSDATGLTARGFDLHAKQTWQELPDRLKPGFLYLLSFNKEINNKGHIQHYHVGLIYANEQGEIWLYHTTGGAKKAYRRNLADAKQRASFLRSFANAGNKKKYLLVLEVPLSQ